jgi:hypothetical protein
VGEPNQSWGLKVSLTGRIGFSSLNLPFSGGMIVLVGFRSIERLSIPPRNISERAGIWPGGSTLGWLSSANREACTAEDGVAGHGRVGPRNTWVGCEAGGRPAGTTETASSMSGAAPCPRWGRAARNGKRIQKELGILPRLSQPGQATPLRSEPPPGVL